MQLDFTPDQDELRENMRSVLSRECPMSYVRGVAEQGGDITSLWDTISELGWTALTVPPDCGGIGLGAVELAILAEELGRAIAPTPLLATVSQFLPALRELGAPRDWMEQIAAGSITGTLAIGEEVMSDDPAHVATTVEIRGDVATVRGTKRWVMDATTSKEMLVVARIEGTTGDDGVTAVVVPVASTVLAPVDSFDITRSFSTVALNDVTVDRSRVLGESGATTATAIRRAIEEATVAMALEIVGTCQTIFDVTLAYAKEREQFGVPIGSFQAIKHKFADMLIALERARATGYLAALAIAEDDPRRHIATSIAKAAAGDAQRLLCKEGIQIHGGIGFTWEADVHVYARRAKTDAALFGTADVHRSRISAALGM